MESYGWTIQKTNLRYHKFQKENTLHQSGNFCETHLTLGVDRFIFHVLQVLLIIFTYKQIYNEASTKLIFLLMYLWLPKLRVC